jgi:hypothetical protein
MGAMVDAFGADVFSLNTMTAAINTAKYKPARIAQMGLFEEEGVNTTTVIIDEEAGTLSLVPVTPRGAPGTPMNRVSRTARPFLVPHIQKNRDLMADEVQGVRAFGTDNQLETVQMKRDQYLARMRADIEATIEFHRVRAIQGIILDADGTTTLYNLFTIFGLTQQTVAMALNSSSTEVRGKCLNILEAIENELGAAPWTGVRAICGSGFWESWVTHAKVKETYLQSQYAASLREDPREEFSFGGIQWERYRGGVGSTPFVPSDEAYVFPEGVPGLFITRFAPADYMETVNTIGLPLYAKGVEHSNGKGVDLESQSNPLSICTRPRAVIKLTKV